MLFWCWIWNYIYIHVYGFMYLVFMRIMRIWLWIHMDSETVVFEYFFWWELPRNLEGSESYRNGPGDDEKAIIDKSSLFSGVNVDWIFRDVGSKLGDAKGCHSSGIRRNVFASCWRWWKKSGILVNRTSLLDIWWSWCCIDKLMYLKIAWKYVCECYFIGLSDSFPDVLYRKVQWGAHWYQWRRQHQSALWGRWLIFFQFHRAPPKKGVFQIEIQVRAMLMVSVITNSSYRFSHPRKLT